MPTVAGAMNEATVSAWRNLWGTLPAQLQQRVDLLVHVGQSLAEVGDAAALPLVAERLERLLVRGPGRRRRRGAGLGVVEDVHEDLELRVQLQVRRGQRLLGGGDVLEAVGELDDRLRVG